MMHGIVNILLIMFYTNLGDHKVEIQVTSIGLETTTCNTNTKTNNFIWINSTNRSTVTLLYV